MRRQRPGALAAALATAFVAGACGGPPVDGVAERRAAEAQLLAAAGPYPESPAGGEAGRRLREALRTLPSDNELRAVLRRLMVQPTAAWSAEDAARLQSALVEREGALAALRGAAATEPAGLSLAVPLPNDAFSELHPALTAARLLVLGGRSALHHADSETATGNAETVMRLAYAMQKEPSGMTQMVAEYLERDALELLADAIVAGDSTTAGAVARGLGRIEESSSLAWIAGDALKTSRDLDQGARNPSESLVFDRALTDLAVAQFFTLQAEMAIALGQGEDEFRVWCETRKRRESVAQSLPGFWARHLLARHSQAELFATSLGELMFNSGNAEKRLAALPARRLAVVAADRAFSRSVKPANEGAVVIGGEEARLQRRSDGSLHLSLPRAMAAWRESFGRSDFVPLRFEWEIPAPADQASKEKLAPAAAAPRS